MQHIIKFKIMNNKTTAQRASLILGMSLLIFLGCLAGSFFVDFEKVILFQIILGILLVLTVAVYYFGGYYYIEIAVENESLNFRHYNLFPFGRKFKLFQIPLKKFQKFEIRKYFFGIFTFLLVYEKSHKGVARYPRIGLSAVPKSHQKLIVSYIERYSKT